MNNVLGVPFLDNQLLAKSGIKIKKKNRGLFTKYCNGKVTQECIDKAKRSGNKKLIKRAVFAENSRKFKHQNGGILKGQNGIITVPVYPATKVNEKVAKVFSKPEVEKIMRASGNGGLANFWDYLFNFGTNSYNGSRISGKEKTYTGLISAKTEPEKDESRDLVSQYLYQKSNLTPYKNPTPIVINGETLTGDQFEGKIFVGDSLRLPKHMEQMVNDYIKNRKLLSLNNNIPGEYGQTYDNVRSHYISFKTDDKGQPYADIFDRWDMDHSFLFGTMLDKYYGKPFILRQKVPISYTDEPDYFSERYLRNINQNLWNGTLTNLEFVKELNK